VNFHVRGTWLKLYFRNHFLKRYTRFCNLASFFQVAPKGIKQAPHFFDSELLSGFRLD
jgi:hypothetical protein